MQDLAFVDTVGTAGRRVGKGIGSLIEKVNPDVWRELGYVSLSSYSLLMSRREPVVDRGNDGLSPVVLVHGLGGNRGAWWPLRLFLRMTGHRRLYAFGYEGGTIQEHAEGLRAFVRSVLEATGEGQVDLVAHSLGGIIARCAIQQLGLCGAVRTLVTLATPHQGTYAAQYANTPLIRSLRPESDMIRNLNADDGARYPRRFYSVFSNRDVYVVPAEAMTHPGAENVFLPDVSHSQYLVSPRVFRVVASCLAGPVPPVNR